MTGALPRLQAVLGAASLGTVALAYFSVSAMQVAAGVLGLIWLLALARGLRPTARELWLPAAVWAAASALAIACAEDTGLALDEAGNSFLPLLAVVLADGLASRGQLASLERAWIGAALLAAGIGLVQIVENGVAFRARGTVGHYMTYAGLELMASQMLLAGLLFGPMRGRLLRGAALALVLVALFLTQTRSAWVALAGGSALLFVLRKPRLLVLLPLLGILAYLLAPAPLRTRIESFADLRDTTLTERVYMWRAGLAMVREHPLTGIGPENVAPLYEAYKLPDDPWLEERRFTHLHSNPLQIAAERGLLGLAAYVLLALVPLVAATRVWRNLARDEAHLRGLVAGALAAQVAFHLAGLFEYSFGDSEVVTVAFAAMALPFAVRHAAAPPEAAGTPAADPFPAASQ